MGIWNCFKRKSSPVPAFGNTGPIKFRSMSFGTTDSLKAYLDATMGQTADGKIIVTYEDAEQIIDYFPTYFEGKEVEYCDSYSDYYAYEVSKMKNDPNLGYGTIIPCMTTGIHTNTSKRTTGYLSGGLLSGGPVLSMERLPE